MLLRRVFRSAVAVRSTSWHILAPRGPVRALCAPAGETEQDPLLVEWRKFLDVGVALYRKGNLPRASQCLSRAYEILGSSPVVSSHQVLRARASTLLQLANVKREIAAGAEATHADKVEAGELYSTTVDLVSRSFGEISAEMGATLLELGRHLMNSKDDQAAAQGACVRAHAPRPGMHVWVRGCGWMGARPPDACARTPSMQCSSVRSRCRPATWRAAPRGARTCWPSRCGAEAS